MEEYKYIDDDWIAELVEEARLYDGVEIGTSWDQGQGGMTTICVGLMARRRSRFFSFNMPFLLFSLKITKESNALIYKCLLSFLKRNSVYFFFYLPY